MIKGAAASASTQVILSAETAAHVFPAALVTARDVLPFTVFTSLRHWPVTDSSFNVFTTSPHDIFTFLIFTLVMP